MDLRISIVIDQWKWFLVEFFFKNKTDVARKDSFVKAKKKKLNCILCDFELRALLN